MNSEYNFKLTESNDGKGKYQSYECTIEELETTQFSITGYGKTAEEAREEMIKKLDKYMTVLSNFKKSLIEPKNPCIGCLYDPNACCMKYACLEKQRYDEEITKRKEFK